MATPVPLREAAGLLGVSRQHVSRLVKTGELRPLLAPCGCRLFDTDELLARRRNPPRRGPVPKHENRLGTPVRPVYMPDVVEIEDAPEGPQATILITVLRSVEITHGGLVVEKLPPGPCCIEAHHGRRLVETGHALLVGE